MNARFIVGVIAVLAVIFGFDYLYHGRLMMPAYEATASLWRPMAEMEQMMGWCIGLHLAYALVFTWVFSKHYQGLGMGEGLRFGLYIGLILGLDAFSNFMWLPVSLNLGLAWFVGGALKGLLVGITLAAVFQKVKAA